MGQTTSSTQQATSIPSSSAGECPMHRTAPSEPAAPPSPACPIKHTPPSASSSTPAQCPIQHDELDPRNHIPVLSQSPAPSQQSHLPTNRTTSSIPRDAEGRWEYPSPQQFHNALARKGWETPEEHVETMVQIHNFLNEMAWDEVQRWESQVNKDEQLQLVKFKGRPGELSPKARFWLFAGWLLPSRFNNEPPFDRHDWIVRRPSTGEEVRYVIDYYSAPPTPDGSPVFSLDVRPALDNVGSISMRIKAATEGMWSSSASEGRV